jgi:para-nitrobenzyl esterase
MSIGPANGIIVDGWVLPEAPAAVFAAGRQAHVPLLVGNNSRERTPPAPTSEELNAAMLAMFGPLAARAQKLYSSESDRLYGSIAAQWVVDTMYRCPVAAQLDWHAKAGNPAYEYQFDRAAPGREAQGAVHGAEVPYVFGALAAGGRGPQYNDTDRDLSAAIQSYWTNFAKSGNPNGRGLPAWPQFDATSRRYLEFTDNGPRPAEALRGPYCALYVENVQRLMGEKR